MTARNIKKDDNEEIIIGSTEHSFDAVLEHLGLEGWHTHWVPRPCAEKRGEVLPESKLILLYDKSLQNARDTLLHEALEIKFQPMLKPYRTLVNALVGWAEGQIYQAKEKAIDDLIPLLLSFEKSDPDSTREMNN